jgi:hypothetical protein
LLTLPAAGVFHGFRIYVVWYINTGGQPNTVQLSIAGVNLGAYTPLISNLVSGELNMVIVNSNTQTNQLAILPAASSQVTGGGGVFGRGAVADVTGFNFATTNPVSFQSDPPVGGTLTFAWIIEAI